MDEQTWQQMTETERAEWMDLQQLRKAHENQKFSAWLHTRPIEASPLESKP